MRCKNWIFNLIQTFAFKGRLADEIVSVLPATAGSKNFPRHQSAEQMSSPPPPAQPCFFFLGEIFLLSFGQYLIKSISPIMMGSLLCCFMNNSISLLASQYKLHSNIRKRILFLHWETNMIPGQISSLPKPKDRRKGSCCLFEAKVYVALTFEVLLVGFEI